MNTNTRILITGVFGPLVKLTYQWRESVVDSVAYESKMAMAGRWGEERTQQCCVALRCVVHFTGHRPVLCNGSTRAWNSAIRFFCVETC